MNQNKKQYQRSFQALHLSDDFQERLTAKLSEEREEKTMNTSAIHGFSRLAAAITICAVTLGVGGICYAADVGGIRTKVELWMNGEKNEVEVEADDTGFSWTDEDGNAHGFGGVALDEEGNEVALSAEELAEHMNNNCDLRAEKGRMMLYYKNISADVTDMINDGKLFVHISDPLNRYTYFSFTDIDMKGAYGCSDSDKPEGNAEYIEIDSSGLSTEGEAVPEREDDVTSVTYVTVEEE